MMMMMMRVLLISVYVGLCSRVHCETVFDPQLNADHAGHADQVESMTICHRCNCINRQIICHVDDKLKTLSRVDIPANYSKLVLSNNHLTQLRTDSFASGADVTDLDLTYNAIRHIEESSLTIFRSLTTLCLAHNSLATLDDGSFSGLEKLEKLDISQNKFPEIRPAYFRRLLNLKYLILDQNPLDSPLRGTVFKNNVHLTHLFLNKLRISDLEEDLFEHTRNLRVLHLEDNFLPAVPQKALSKLSKLEVLVLSGNPIHVITAMNFPKTNNLQQLVLSNMYHLKRIDVYAFAELRLLRNLKIQHCKNLVYIDPEAFNLETRLDKARYPELKNLVIRDTAISTLSWDLLNWNDVDDVDLSLNIFHCNCNLSWIVDFVRKHDVNNDVRCSAPAALAHQVIRRIQPKKMLCDNYDPLNDVQESHMFYRKTVTEQEGGKRFPLLHLSVIVILSVTIALSAILVISIKRRGFIYRKLGSKTTPTYAAGENVLYMQTTIDR